MRIMVVHPGPMFSTHDVFIGVCAGLVANGVDVIPYPLNNALLVNQSIYNVAAEYAPETAAHFDPYAVTGHALVGMAIWKECDVVLVITGDRVHFAAIHTLKKAGITTALLCTESPYLTVTRERYDARHYDVVFTNERNAVALFSHPNAHYLAHAYNPEMHYPGAGEAAKRCDTFFVGTAFEERKALFAGVNWTGIAHVELGTLWRGDESMDLITADVTNNSEVVGWYRSARINLNHHRTTSKHGTGTYILPGDAESLGPRAYEIAACKGFQLMDDSRPEAREVFGDSLATYKAGNSADLEKQIRYWLQHDNERVAFAQAQHEAIQPHSWEARASFILDVLSAGGRSYTTSQEQPAWQLDTV